MTQYLTCWLITYAVAFIVAETHGPFGWCRLFRVRMKQRFRGIKWIEEGVECPICIGFWSGMILAVLFGDEFFRTWLSSVGFVCLVTALRPD